MSDLFYKAFEDRYRGSREIIGERLRAYLPFITPLASTYRPARALDIGCGRGEWLELAVSAGFEARGVDIDDGMLEPCRERGLAVQTADGLQALRAMPDASVAMVSAFHVVEHIPFDDVRALIAEALRVLQPGGLLILETPNPENVLVGASSFYRDPSHLRPLPPELLSFAAEFAGFARNLVVRLQEPAEVHTADADGLLGLRHVLEGVSPDYAVVAQKAAAPEVMQRFDAPFGARYGISLGRVMNRYDEQAVIQRGALDTAAAHGLQALDHVEAVRVSVAGLSDHVSQNRQNIAALSDNVAHDRRDIAGLSDHVAQSRQDIASLDQRLAAQLDQHAQLSTRLETRLAEADAVQREFNAVLASRSWRLTAPLRAASFRVGRLRAAVRDRRLGAALKWRLKHALRELGKAVLRNPGAKRAARAALAHFPALQARLREMMVQAPVAPGAPPPPTQQAADLSPRAQRLYAGLKQALDDKET